MVQEKRRRGGQQGNKNALKHGYYSKIFNGEDKHDYCLAGSVEGIDQEIALIRHVIKTVAKEKDEKSLSILVRATNSLNRLLRTRLKIQPFDEAALRRSLTKLINEVTLQAGITPISDVIGRNTGNQSTNIHRNEPDQT